MRVFLRKLVARIVGGSLTVDETLRGKNVERLAWRKFSRAAVIWKAMQKDAE